MVELFGTVVGHWAVGLSGGVVGMVGAFVCGCAGITLSRSPIMALYSSGASRL